jgi:uracil-DNA glycosylase
MHVEKETTMRVSQIIQCGNFPCADVKHECYITPDIDLNPETIRAVMISEAAPASAADYYYAGGKPLFQETTLQAFRDAGLNVTSLNDILKIGVYLTTAVKCGKTGSGINSTTTEGCSHLLEKELALFSNIQVYLLMGDVAIKSLNLIAKRTGQPRVIPAGSTYKIRGQQYFYQGRRAFPSYLQAGPSFFIEKSKRKMIAEDIHQAMTLI